MAGTSRTDDFESFAYDQSSDSLYLFSGPCCNTSILPTAFRLTRQSGAFQVESYQPLAGTANYTASAWNSADQMIYVGATNQLRTYHYETNIAGPAFQIPNLAAILGMGFSSDGADLFVVTNAEVLKRVDWGSRTVVPGWTFNLLPFDVRDSRGVELIGDQLYVSDGADSRPAGPLKYAVFVFDVLGDSGEPQASFTANPSSGNAPLTVTFDNTTTGDTPMTWEWDFDGDGSTDSTAENPTFVFDTPDTYTVELTATNPSGSDTTTRNVVVTDPPQPPSNLVGNPGFEVNTAGWGVTGSGTGITLARVTNPVHAGAGAARLMNGSTGTRKCVLNDVPNWVTTTQAGLYTGSIWVRGASPGAQIKVNFRELNGSSVLRSRTQTYTLTTSWQLVSVTHRPISPGTSTIDLQVFLPKAQAPPGVCFYADDASITRS